MNSAGETKVEDRSGPDVLVGDEVSADSAVAEQPPASETLQMLTTDIAIGTSCFYAMYTRFYSVSGKKETKMFSVISQTKLGRSS